MGKRVTVADVFALLSGSEISDEQLNIEYIFEGNLKKLLQKQLSMGNPTIK